MIKMLKKAVKWYVTKAAETDLCTPSCTIPVKYVMNI